MLYAEIGLFSDTKVLKDIPQNFIGGNLSDYAAEVVDCLADVLGGEVGREAGGKAFSDAEEGSAGVAESLDMTLVCDKSCVTVAEKITL